jgi:hypothetical protein
LLLLACVAFLIPSLAYGGVGFGLKGGIQKATASDDNSENMTLFGADVRLTSLPMVEVIVAGDYSWKKYSGDGFVPDMKFSIFSVTGSAVMPFKTPMVTPYAGGGLGYYNIKSEIGDLSGTDNKTGFHIVAGFRAGTPAMPFKLFAEYRHHWVSLDGGTGKYYTLAGGVIFGAF